MEITKEIKENFCENLFAKRLLVVLLTVFTVCSFRLCAEDMTPAKAQVARETFIEEAKKYVGSPYVYGAIGPDSFDCSGYVYYVARESINMQLPRTAKALYNYCRIVPDKSREPGDLLFFRTTASGSISHVGIYLGNNKFISALSDGPNSGVVLSSLNQDYWKGKYVAAGQFLNPGINRVTPQSAVYEEEFVDDEEEPVVKKTAAVKKSNVKSNTKTKSKSSSDTNFIVDTSIMADWSLISPNEFMFKFRGIDVHSNIRMANVMLQPGVGLGLRFNTSLGIFEMPILFSTTINDYLKVYAGPVVSFGKAVLLGTEKDIKASAFPGIIGCSISTPKVDLGPVHLQVVQDINYSVFNNVDNSALSFVESLSAGLLMNTGLKVSYDF